MSRAKLSFDQRCYDLAEVFLSDEADLNHPANRNRLAQHIQHAIESWIADANADFADAKFAREISAPPFQQKD